MKTGICLYSHNSCLDDYIYRPNIHISNYTGRIRHKDTGFI